MRNAMLGSAAFAGWCALVLAAPFIAFRLGVLTSMDFERWIAISHAATWRALVPPTVLFVSAALAARSSRWPAIAAWVGGFAGVVAGFLLMDQAMKGNAGQFDGLIEIVALLLGAGAGLIGLLLGTWCKARMREPTAF